MEVHSVTKKSLLWVVTHIEESLSAVLLAAMATIAFVNVLTRFGLNYSLAFTEELTVYFSVWVTLLGISLAFREKNHMVVTMFYDMLPGSTRKAAYLFAALCNIAFFAILGYWGFVQVHDEMMLQVRTESMHMPMWFFSASIPVVSCFIIMRVVFRTIHDVKSGNYDY